MRHIICKEADDTVPGHYIMPGALDWAEGDRIPLTFNFDFQQVIGWATDIRREEGGIITAEIVLESQSAEVMRDEEGTYVAVTVDELDAPLDMDSSVYMSPVKSHGWNDVRWVESAFIRAAALVPRPFWKRN